MTKSRENQKTQTLLNIIATAMASGNLQIEASALPELFEGEMVANVHAKVPGQWRKKRTYGDNRDLKSIHEVVAQTEFDTNFKGWVSRAYRTQSAARAAGRDADGPQTVGRTPDEAVKALRGQLTTASNLRSQPSAAKRRQAKLVGDAQGRKPRG